MVAICVEVVARPFSAAQYRTEMWIQKLNPGAWLWPDED
jgi:hypothetical protein